jgi:hypothetical protein
MFQIICSRLIGSLLYEEIPQCDSCDCALEAARLNQNFPSLFLFLWHTILCSCSFCPSCWHAVYIKASVINWNWSKLVEHIKMKLHFSNSHVVVLNYIFLMKNDILSHKNVAVINFNVVLLKIIINALHINFTITKMNTF